MSVAPSSTSTPRPPRDRPTGPPGGGRLARALAGLRLIWRLRRRAWRSRRAGRPRIKPLRLLAILIALAALGCISFAFGMFMAVASQLPALEDWQRYNGARNSIMRDDHGHLLAVLSQRNQILVTPKQIPAIVKEAVISIEDRRFYTNEGIDCRSIARASTR